jgi:iron-sulfur cluster assembly protein
MQMKDIVTVTPAADRYVSDILVDNPSMALKVGYDNRGCSGHKYTFNLIPDDDIKPYDDVIQLSSGRMVIDPMSVMGLIGSTLDLHVDQFEQQLEWHNPMAVNACGCGASFQLESETRACAK